MTRRLPVFLLFLFVMGCVTAEVLRLGAPTQYAPVLASEVQIFMTAEDVPGEFEKIALIKLKGDSDFTNETRMIEKAKAEAAKLGANGIILGETVEPSAGAKVAGTVLGVSTSRRGEVIAIRFTVSTTEE